MKFDLHIHSKYSNDGVLDPRDIVKLAIARGLSGIAITDHNTISGAEEAKIFAGNQLIVILGEEIMTDKGEVIGLFLSRKIEPSKFQDVIVQIKEQGGIVVIPHPFDKMRKSAFPITREYASFVDAIEGFNSRCILNKYNNQAIQFAEQNKLSIVSGSDAHFACEIGLAGVLTHSKDIRLAIIDHQLEIFGKRSSIMNHARTKFLKWSRKVSG